MINYINSEKFSVDEMRCLFKFVWPLKVMSVWSSMPYIQKCGIMIITFMKWILHVQVLV